jgi:hypothetical protein
MLDSPRNAHLQRHTIFSRSSAVPMNSTHPSRVLIALTGGRSMSTTAFRFEALQDTPSNLLPNASISHLHERGRDGLLTCWRVTHVHARVRRPSRPPRDVGSRLARSAPTETRVRPRDSRLTQTPPKTS